MAMAKKIFIVLFWFMGLSAIIAGMSRVDIQENLDIRPKNVVETIGWDTPVRICGPQQAIMGGKLSCDFEYHDQQNHRILSGGIAGECCIHPCTPMYILQYCARQSAKIGPLVLHTNTLAVSTTTSTSVIQRITENPCADHHTICRYMKILTNLVKISPYGI